VGARYDRKVEFRKRAAAPFSIFHLNLKFEISATSADIFRGYDPKVEFRISNEE
jgi:hypothetical protein